MATSTRSLKQETLNRELVNSIREGDDVERVRQLLADGAQATGSTPHDDSPIYLAAFYGRLEVVKLLLEHSPPKDKVEANHLFVASAYTGSIPIAQLLLDRGAEVNGLGKYHDKTALHYAAEDGHPEMIEWLLSRGANIEAKNSSGKTPLQDAIDERREDAAYTLMMHGANSDIEADENGHTLISTATHYGLFKVVKLLLERKPVTGKQDIQYLFMAAAGSGSIPTAKIFLDLGADLNGMRQYSEETALHAAAERNQSDMIEWLLDLGMDINAVDSSGNTPLHKAAERKCEGAICTLVDRDADTTIKNKYENRTAAHLALGDVKCWDEEGEHQTVYAGRAKERLIKIARQEPPSEFKALAERLLRSPKESSDEHYAMQKVNRRMQSIAISLTGHEPAACRAMFKTLLGNQLRYAQEQGISTWQELVALFGKERSPSGSDIVDVVTEFSRYVLLPKLIATTADRIPLEDNNLTIGGRKDWLRWLDEGSLTSRLRIPATRALFEKFTPHEIEGFSRAWHAAGSRFPQEWRPLAGGEWYSFTTAPVITVADGPAKGCTLHCLTSCEALEEEGSKEVMSHCVANYAPQCKAGTHAVYSVRDPNGNRLSTLGIRYNKTDHKWEIFQNQGRGNVTPPQIAKDAAEWLLAELEKPNVVNKNRGETEESKKFRGDKPKIYRDIGFEPNSANIARAFRHYGKETLRTMTWNEEKQDYSTRGPHLINAEAASKPVMQGMSHSQRRAHAKSAQGKGKLDTWMQETGMYEEFEKIRQEKWAKMMTPVKSAETGAVRGG